MTITSEQAKVLAKWWTGLTDREIVTFQLFTDNLCMPWSRFHEAVTKALGRSVWTHEFAKPDLLRAEFLGELPAPTFDEILSLIPSEKLVIVGLR